MGQTGDPIECESDGGDNEKYSVNILNIVGQNILFSCLLVEYQEENILFFIKEKTIFINNILFWEEMWLLGFNILFYSLKIGLCKC